MRHNKLHTSVVPTERALNMSAKPPATNRLAEFAAQEPRLGEPAGFCLQAGTGLSPAEVLPITETEFNEIKHARSLLVDALAFEQKYELLLANWFALEACATSISLSSRVESWTSYGRSSETMNALNRHVMNLLSTARSYIDQVKRDFSVAPLSPPFKTQAETAFSAQFDASFAYRFMEGLRNQVQHSCLPVHRVSPLHTAQTWADAMTFYSLLSEFEGGGHRGFNAKVWKELQAHDSFDLRLFARLYISSLSAVHITLRNIVAEPVAAARGTFERTIDRYKVAGTSSAVGLRAYAAESLRENSIPVLIDWDEIRITLAKKNARPIDLGQLLPRLA